MTPAPTRLTARVLTAGTLASAASFLLGVVLGLVRPAAGPGDSRDLGAVATAALALEPWAWSTLGVVILVATPAAGLVATVLEARERDRRSALLAAAVLGVLAASVVVAGLR